MTCRIPRTRFDFEQKPFDIKVDVKKKLLKENFSEMCEALNPETIKEFSTVLHKNDLEKLQKQKERDCKSNVIMELLISIQRSYRQKPTWWEILDRVLKADDSMELYWKMNPWEPRNLPGGAAGGGGGQGGGGGGQGGGGGGGRGDKDGEVPSVSLRTSPLIVGGPPRLLTPYPGSTPLSQTAGIHYLLRPVFADGNDRPWRDLADLLGLPYGAQLKIIKQQQHDTGLGRLLLDAVIEHTDDGVTVDHLVRALRDLGPTGERVVRDMGRRGVIHPLLTAGSEADGEVVVGGAFNDDEGGGASARSCTVPSPRVPTVKPSLVDSLPVNMSSSVHDPKPSHQQPDLSSFIKTERQANIPRSSSSELAASERHRNPSTESVVDNGKQPLAARNSDGALDYRQEKVLNISPGSIPLEADSASSPLPVQQEADEAIPAYIAQSQQQIEDELLQKPAQTAQQPQPRPDHQQQNIHVHINTMNYIERTRSVMLGVENTVSSSEDSARRGEERAANSLPASLECRPPHDEESTERGGCMDQGSEGNTGEYEASGNNLDGHTESSLLDSYRPDPANSREWEDFHRTVPKQTSAAAAADHTFVSEQAEVGRREDDYSIHRGPPENGGFPENIQIRSIDSLPEEASADVQHEEAGVAASQNDNVAPEQLGPAAPHRHRAMGRAMGRLGWLWSSLTETILHME